MQVTRFQQSTLLIEDRDTRILIDPGSLSEDSAFTLDSITAILFTHAHPDHFDPNRIVNLIERNPALAVYAASDVIDQLPTALKHRQQVDTEATFTVGSLNVEAFVGLHHSIHRNLPRPTNVGFVVSNGSGTRLFHPGDSYAVVPENVTALAVPVVGPWGSLQEAVDFADAVAPDVMFPIHDVHLSETGNELFWPWLKNLSSSEIEGIDAAPGETITVA